MRAGIASCRWGFLRVFEAAKLRGTQFVASQRVGIMAAHFRLSCPNPGKSDLEMPPGFAFKLFATVETAMGTHPYRLKTGFPGPDLSQGNPELQIARIGAEMFGMERRTHLKRAFMATSACSFPLTRATWPIDLEGQKRLQNRGLPRFFRLLRGVAGAAGRERATRALSRWPGAPPSEALGSHETFGDSPISPADQANSRFSRRIRRPERRPVAGALQHRPGTAWTAVRGFRGRIAAFHSSWPGAAHPLQNHRGTAQEEARPTQAFAGRHRHEETAQ